MTDAEYFTALKNGAAKGDVVLSRVRVQNNIHDAPRLDRKAWRMGVTDAANNIEIL